MKYLVSIWMVVTLLLTTSPIKSQQTYPVDPGGYINPDQWYNDASGGGLSMGPGPSGSLKSYCPTPGNQGQHATSNAWAVAHARTILAAKKEEAIGSGPVNKLRFDPLFMQNALVDSDDKACQSNIELGETVQFVRQQGALPASSASLSCNKPVTESMLAEASQHPIGGFTIVFKDRGEDDRNKLFKTKFAISRNHPVVMNFFTYFPPKDPTLADKYQPTFWAVEDQWVPATSELNKEISTRGGSHTMVIVGYDDNKYGGAFQVMNSFGTDWGNGGYCWITYEDFLKVANGGFELYPSQK